MKRIASFVIDKVFDGLLVGKQELWDGFDARILDINDVAMLSGMMEKARQGFGREMPIFAEQLIREYGGNPIRILSLYNGIGTEGSQIEMPTTQVSTRLFSQRPAWHTAAYEKDIQVNVCDSHLHGGLAIDVGSLYLSLVRRTEPINVRSYGSMIKKLGPLAVDVPLSLSISRWATWIFVSLVSSDWREPEWCDEHPLHSLFFKRIEQGKFWTEVRRVCFSQDTLINEQRNAAREQLLCLDLNCPQEIDRSIDPASALVQTVKSNPDWLSDVNSWQNQFVLGLVRFCTMLFGTGVAYHGDGLDGFHDRVESCGSLKKIILKSAKGSSRGASKLLLDNKRTLYQQSFDVARSSFNYPYVFGGCEFRQNLHENLCSDRDVGMILKEIRDSITPAWLAFYDYLEGHDGSSFRFCTPLAFQRVPSQGYVSSGGAFCAKPGFEFTEAAITANAILQFYGTIGGNVFSSLVGGVDVSGVETWSQNWPYVSAINWLKNKVDTNLNFTVHSGESFPYRMRGLRMIGECFLGEQPPDRIGHALALSERASCTIEEKNKKLPIPKRELVADLCWFHGVHDSGFKCACLDLISRLTTANNALASLDPQAWVDAFSLLHQSTLVDKIVSVVPAVSGSGFENVLSEEVQWRTSRDRWDVDFQVFQAAYLLAWDSLPGYGALDCNLDKPATTDINNSVREYFEENLSQAERIVKDVLREYGTIIEACPTSNLTLSGLYRYQDLPLWDWIDDGINVSINSDDPLVFVTFAGDELDRLECFCGSSGRHKLRKSLKSLAFGGHCQEGSLTCSDVEILLSSLSDSFGPNGVGV